MENILLNKKKTEVKIIGKDEESGSWRESEERERVRGREKE